MVKNGGTNSFQRDLTCHSLLLALDYLDGSDYCDLPGEQGIAFINPYCTFGSARLSVLSNTSELVKCCFIPEGESVNQFSIYFKDNTPYDVNQAFTKTIDVLLILTFATIDISEVSEVRIYNYRIEIDAYIALVGMRTATDQPSTTYEDALCFDMGPQHGEDGPSLSSLSVSLPFVFHSPVVLLSITLSFINIKLQLMPSQQGNLLCSLFRMVYMLRKTPGYGDRRTPRRVRLRSTSCVLVTQDPLCLQCFHAGREWADHFSDSSPIPKEGTKEASGKLV